MAQKYLLDTNICIFFMKNKYNVVDKIRAVGRENCAVSEITAAELYYGASFSTRAAEEMKLVDRFLNLIEVVPISTVLKEYGHNKALLRRQGTLIDDFDLLIGSTATVHNMIAVTENVKHIARIPNIQIENWVNR